MNESVTHWVVVPAAGSGRRMELDTPKQYLPLAGRTVLGVTLERLVRGIRPRAVVVALGAADERWETIDKPAGEILAVAGGEARCHSVMNALEALKDRAGADDWVWVHDAARPCVRVEDLERLAAAVAGHPVGGLLALKMTDTVKQADEDGVAATVDRSRLWRALTPQVFRYGLLREALRRANEAGRQVTDEAQAMELAGCKPRLVEGSADNIKITAPGDLEIAEVYLARQADAAA